MTFSIVLGTLKQKQDFSEFYYNKIKEIQPFTTDAAFGLYTSKDKGVRFSGPIEIQELGGGILEIKGILELIDPVNASHGCVLVPHDDLYPDNTLYPNVCPKP